MNASTKPEIQVPATIGTAFEGGFYGGKIRIGVAIFAIVWAPKVEGEITGKWLDTYIDVHGATSCFDSIANTKAMADAGSPIAKQALAASIGGHTDWCVPARDVLEMGYRNFKPTTSKNYEYRNGDNPSSIPAGYPYTETSPAQTTVEAFQEGNAEAFEDVWYASSTQFSERYAWDQDFNHGDQDEGLKVYERRCRFVRLIQLSPSILFSRKPTMQVAIENQAIKQTQAETALARAFVESLLRMPDAPAEASAPAQPDANTTTSATTPPNIGEYWPGQGGIYAGVASGRDGEADYHLILSTEAPEEEFEWQAALDRAKSVSADGHSDFTVPTRFESALLYANLQDQFDTSYWYWTSTQFSESSAWTQDFDGGSQGYDRKVYERRCRFVRRSVL